MNCINISWTDFKNFLLTRDASIDYVEFESNYQLCSYNGQFSVSCTIEKGTDDSIEFETSYTILSNSPVVTWGLETTQQSVLNELLPLSTFQTSQLNVTTTAQRIAIAALPNRKTISIKVKTAPSDTIYIGNSSYVVINTGYLLNDGDAIDLELGPLGEIWVVASSSDVDNIVYILEVS